MMERSSVDTGERRTKMLVRVVALIASLVLIPGGSFLLRAGDAPGRDAWFVAGFVLGVAGRLSGAVFFFAWAALAATRTAKVVLGACGAGIIALLLYPFLAR